MSTAKSFGKAPTLRGLDEETKAWKEQIDDLRNTMKGSKGILNAAAKKVDAMLDEKNGRINEIIQQELRGLELLVLEMAAQYE